MTKTRSHARRAKQHGNGADTPPALNWVRAAVDELTGPTAAANRIGVSGSSIHKWIMLGYVPLSGDCQRLSEASGIPFAKLAGPKRA